MHVIDTKTVFWAERCNHSWLWLAQWDEMDMVDLFQRAAWGHQVLDDIWHARSQEVSQVILPGLLFLDSGKRRPKGT